MKQQKKYQTVHLKIELNSLRLTQFEGNDDPVWTTDLGGYRFDGFQQESMTIAALWKDHRPHSFLSAIKGLKSFKIIQTARGDRKLIGYFEKWVDMRTALDNQFDWEQLHLSWNRHDSPSQRTRSFGNNTNKDWQRTSGSRQTDKSKQNSKNSKKKPQEAKSEKHKKQKKDKSRKTSRSKVLAEILDVLQVIKTKSTIDNKGTRRYGYKVIWKILEEKNREINEKSEIMFLANYEGINENEFKVILRSIILSLLIISEKSDIVLGINENIQKLINEFRNNSSNRKKIDSDFYLELLFIENFIEKYDIEILDLNARNYKITKELRLKARENLKSKEIIKYNFEIIDDALITNEFNLYWNQRLINGGYRGWRKKITNVIWKNEILNSNRLDDLFMYNYKREYDWQTTLEFISNRIECSKRQCGTKDTYERSYRIKNLLKDQPTYDTLFRRNTNKIEDNKCIRCKKNEIENWEHLWICEDNDNDLNEIIYESISRFEQILKESNQNEEVTIMRNFNIEFINILESPSIILRGKSRIWELIRVKRLEEKDGIKKAELRKRKNEKDTDLDNNSNSETKQRKNKKQKQQKI
ncbi:unnamed protein product [Rhizophagus irregularis]|nr:unnamed protein product [Rhizophagus irregularis]